MGEEAYQVEPRSEVESKPEVKSEVDSKSVEVYQVEPRSEAVPRSEVEPRSEVDSKSAEVYQVEPKSEVKLKEVYISVSKSEDQPRPKQKLLSQSHHNGILTLVAEPISSQLLTQLKQQPQ